LRLERHITEWTSRRVDFSRPKLLLEPFIPQMLLGSVTGPNVSATLPSVVGGATFTPPHVAPPTGGYPGGLSPTTAPGSLYVPSCSSSSPYSPSFILSQISSSSPIPEIPASPQPHFYNDSASVPDRQTSSATSTTSLCNTDYSAAPCSNADDVHLSPPAEQNVGRSGRANIVVPPATGSTEQWSHEARPHIPAIPPPPGSLGVQPSQNHLLVVHQPLGAHAPHDVQNIDPAVTIGNGLHHPGAAYYDNRTQPIQSVNFAGNQRPRESQSLCTWSISHHFLIIYFQRFRLCQGLSFLPLMTRNPIGMDGMPMVLRT
jgi:hypothetical protein